MTAHINANKEDISNIVIMPGDPKRAKYITETFLENYKCINEVRGMLGFTGFYKGKKITVMASGMGMPSMGIYSYELFNYYDVDLIIRVGSMGAYDESLNLYDTFLATEAYSDSSYARVQNGTNTNILKPDIDINDKIKSSALEKNINLKIGRIYSSDVFYVDNHDYHKMNKDLGCFGTEMEGFALFHNANILNKKAACLLTVSNHFITGEETTSEEREKSFNNMIVLALEAALKI